jgi:hypothetical protein
MIDETAAPAGPIAVDRVIRHTEADLLAMGLPRAGVGNMLWFNGDYPLYLFAQQQPEYTHVLQIEYDVAVNTGIGEMLRRMEAEQVDFIGLTKGEPAAQWPWRESCLSVYDPAGLQHQLICLSAFSTRALRHLWLQRLRHAEMLRHGAMSAWPMCEAFIPMELSAAGFKMAELSSFGDTAVYDHWPPYLERDVPELASHAFVHPVLDPPRFIASMLKYHVGLAGYFSPGSLFHRKLRRLPAWLYARTLVTTFLSKAERNLRAMDIIRSSRGNAA